MRNVIRERSAYPRSTRNVSLQTLGFRLGLNLKKKEEEDEEKMKKAERVIDLVRPMPLLLCGSFSGTLRNAQRGTLSGAAGVKYGINIPLRPPTEQRKHFNTIKKKCFLYIPRPIELKGICLD